MLDTTGHSLYARGQQIIKVYLTKYKRDNIMKSLSIGKKNAKEWFPSIQLQKNEVIKLKGYLVKS